jgi:hypothetical protein
LVILLPLAAQTSFTAFQAGFAEFSDAVANSLPFNALIGQQWSDAFIGSFPHLGVGVTIGATTLPYAAVKPVIDLFGITLPPEIAFLEDLGAPLPAYSIDARLGLPVIPMDIGVKFGMLPQEAKMFLPADLSLDYLLIGGDVRYALIKGNIVLPDVSIGAGYTYLKGTFGVDGLLGGAQDITNVDGHTISLSDPTLNFNWETSVIDLNAQASMNLLIFSPFIGAGAAFGKSTAGGGLASDVLFDGSPITQADIDQIKLALDDQAPDLSSQGIATSSAADGWAFRVFGGVGMNILVIRLDIAAMYNFTSNAFGASVNLRVQL